jgi:hypothetical protein
LPGAMDRLSARPAETPTWRSTVNSCSGEPTTSFSQAVAPKACAENDLRLHRPSVTTRREAGAEAACFSHGGPLWNLPASMRV